VQWGGATLQAEGQHHQTGCRGRGLDETPGEHIFFLELFAAIEGLAEWIWADALPGFKDAKVTLVDDNAAAVFAMRHGFSSNPRASALIDSPRAAQAC
jgi:hypothetical protein